MLAQLPSLAALASNEDGPLDTELRLVNLRSQAAVIRTLADQVEQLSRAEDVEGLGLQIVEEMARLGTRLLEAARTVTREPPPEDSGVFAKAGGVLTRRT
jgi:hypothetical protein